MNTNVSTYERCDYSLADSSNSSIIGMKRHIAALSIHLFLKQESDIIVSHRSKPEKLEVKDCPNS